MNAFVLIRFHQFHKYIYIKKNYGTFLNSIKRKKNRETDSFIKRELMKPLFPQAQDWL